MGSRGPVPEREENLARDRSRKGGEQAEITKGQLMPVVWPEPDPEWHKLALDMYEGCRQSGQAAFYQQSDIALLASLCDDLSYAKNSSKRSGQLLDTIYRNMSNLLISEGDRRRVRIELSEPEPDENPASVTAIADYKAKLGLVPDKGDASD